MALASPFADISPSKQCAPGYAAPSTTGLVEGHGCCPPLYVSGDRTLLERPSVAVVGSRAASGASLNLACAVARILAARGLVVLSGLAAGVDTAAHVAAIEAGGRTIAVIGTDLNRSYPQENAKLQERIYREHLLVSPFAPGTITRPSHFPMRNRVMARLALATVVVAAGEKSGTRHQVRECLVQKRPVLVARHLVGTVGWLRDLHRAGRVVVWDDPTELRELVAGY